MNILRASCKTPAPHKIALLAPVLSAPPPQPALGLPRRGGTGRLADPENLRQNHRFSVALEFCNWLLIPLVLLFLTGCGYHFDTQAPIAISVPYVIGDEKGGLTNALVKAISSTPHFRYVAHEGDWMLKVKVLKDESDRIGFRYDRDDESGELRTNIVGTENRKELAVEVTVISCSTGKDIIGPQTIKAYTEYDYVDANSLKDLSFTDPQTGRRLTSIAFSLGQLDSVGSAGEDALFPVYKRLAQKIVDGLTVSGDL